MPDNVKCAECGYLAVRHVETRQLLDAEIAFREQGSLPSRRSPDWIGIPIYDELPVCFARAVSFRQEIKTPASDERRLDCVQKQRNCDKITDWHQGFTPKEHREMLLSKEALEIQREEQANDRIWRDTQATKDHEWRKEEAAWRRKELWVMGGIVTFVSVVAQIISAFIERGDLFKSQRTESTVVSPLETQKSDAKQLPEQP